MLAACAARLRGQEGMVWVDLGGGTGENVDLMASYIDLSAFKQIYVVDLCKSLCEQVSVCTALHLQCAVRCCTVRRCSGGR
jgi:ubiquinone/menaquinone biosynthesis C-methylase UbiE